MVPGKSQTHFNEVDKEKKETVLDKYQTVQIHAIEDRVSSQVQTRHFQNMVLCEWTWEHTLRQL